MLLLALILSLLPRFANYNTADCLPSNTVYAITQDQDGNLWVGTRGGLSRFDGERFQTVIADKRITSLAVDRDKRLWVGTTTGIEGGPEGNIRAMRADSEGYVWATVGDSLMLKLYYKDGIIEKARCFYDKRYSEGDYPYYQIYEAQDRKLWPAGRIVRFQYIEDRNHPEVMHPFGDGGFCTGSYAEAGGKLYAFDDHTSILYTYEDGKTIPHGRLPIAHARLLTDSKGRLWAAGSYGLGQVDPQHPEQTVVYRHSAEDPHSIASHELYCIFEDHQGNIWVGGDNGLSVLSTVMQHVQTIDIPQVSALMEAMDGRLWVGTADNGTFVLPENRQMSQGSPVSALYEDSCGAIYMGLYSGKGFDIWEKGRLRRGVVSGPIPARQEKAASGDRISSNWITDFLESRDGRFYVVTWEGVGINEWDRSCGKTLPPEWLSPFWYPSPQEDSSIFLSSRLGSRLIEDADGNLVYGTTEAGLNIIDKETRLVTKYYKGNSTIPDDYVTDLCLAPDSTLWVATHSGLWSPSRGSYLEGKLIQSVLADGRGRLWAGTEDGLWFVDTDGSIGVARKALGFPSDIYAEKAACSLSDGRLAFGGPEGAAIFHPDSLLSLKASGNLLLASLVQHRYRMNGGEWISGRFTGLPDNIRPGRYVLEEQSSDIFGRWDRGETAIRTIRAPWPLWLQWPFLLLYALALASVIWVFVRLRERRLLEKELDMRNRLFSIISHDLRNPVSGYRLLAHQLLEKADKLSTEQIKDGLEAIATSADNTSALLENLLLWSLNQKGMLKPVMRDENLLALAKEAVESVQGHSIITLDIPEGLTVQTDRNMLLTCLRNLLDNAVKAPSTAVVLRGDVTQLIILDNGPGMKDACAGWGHGLGLVITRELLEKMGAGIGMRNRPEGGLEITITL